MDDTMTEDSPTAGHNNPPTPFEEVQTKINDLYDEAKGWLDGEGITSQGEADAVNVLKNMISDAEKEAEALRKEEAKPFDDGKAEVQARYLTLIGNTKSVTGKTVLALDVIKKAETPWLQKLEAEKAEIARQAEADARAAQEVAEKAFRETASDDLAGREDAERLADVARDTEIAAKVAGKDKAHAKGGTGRASFLRSVYTPEITNREEFAAFLWNNRESEVNGWLREMATTLVNQNHDQSIPGVTIHHERRV